MPETTYANLLEVAASYATPASDIANYIVRNYVVAPAAGIQKFFYYSFGSSHQINRRECSGFLEWDGVPRPSAVAYAVCAWILEDAVFAKKLTLGEGAAAYQFTKKNEKIVVLWALKNGKKEIVKLPVLPDSRVRIFNIIGNEIKINKAGDILNLTVDYYPLYVVETIRGTKKYPGDMSKISLFDGQREDSK